MPWISPIHGMIAMHDMRSIVLPMPASFSVLGAGTYWDPGGRWGAAGAVLSSWQWQAGDRWIDRRRHIQILEQLTYARTHAWSHGPLLITDHHR